MSAKLRAEQALEELKTKNPYYEKYASKIANVHQTSPDEFLNRIEKAEEQKTPAEKTSSEKERFVINPNETKNGEYCCCSRF